MPYQEGVWPEHPNETHRLKLLRDFEVLDSEFERAFDRFTEVRIFLAVTECTPCSS